MKLVRGGLLNGDQTADVAKFISSAEHDPLIADDVLEINLAHTLMLVRIGFLSPSEGKALGESLESLRGKITSVPPEMEDIHMVIEAEVTRLVGDGIGGKLHTGKSRNDQVATALRMRTRTFLISIGWELLALQEALLSTSRETEGMVMPGFTHLQHAQPITVGHHLLAYFDMFGRDLERIIGCYTRVNQSPMGAAALAGTGYPLDRSLLAEYLGFDGLVENTLDAVGSRDFCLEAAATMSVLLANLSRMAEELVLWSSHEFGFVDMPDDHSSTSSIMPQKKNPVTAEIVRARVGDVFGELTSMIIIMKALPMTYNLDMQEVTPHLWRACNSTLSTLKVLSDLLRKLKFRERRLRSLVKGDFSVATEVADVLVREGGLPFRKAHQVVGSLVKDLIASSSSLSEAKPQLISDLIFEKAGVRLPIETVKKATNPIMNVNVRKTRGGPSTAEVRRMVAARDELLKTSEATLASLAEGLEAGKKTMRSDLSAL